MKKSKIGLILLLSLGLLYLIPSPYVRYSKQNIGTKLKNSDLSIQFREEKYLVTKTHPVKKSIDQFLTMVPLFKYANSSNDYFQIVINEKGDKLTYSLSKSEFKMNNQLRNIVSLLRYTEQNSTKKE